MGIGGIDMGPEIRLLSGLATALAARQVKVELWERFPGLAVSTAVPGVSVWVFVSTTGRWFAWQEAERYHPVSDPEGAADRIVAYVRDRGRQWGAS